MKRCPILWTCLLTASTLGARSAAAEGDKTYQAAIVPFLKQHCLSCHGADKKPKGDLRLDTLRGVMPPRGGETEVWVHILERLQSRDMPPKGEPVPDAMQLETVLDWVRTELRKVGKDDAAELAYPSKGNYLSHQLLFGAPSKAAPATPARLWRISPYQYDELMVRLIPPMPYNKTPTPIGLTLDHGFRDYAFRYTVGSAETQQMMLNARQLLARVVRLDPKKNPLANLAKLKTAPTDVQLQAVVVWLFEEILVRKPDNDELKRYGDLLARGVQRFGNEQGVIQGLAPVFLHPEVVFRSELGAGPRDEHGRVLLTQRELAFALALALTDRPPDAPLLKATQDGSLTERAAVRREVERMLNDVTLAKPRILRFFQEYFGYSRAAEVFKDRYPSYRRDQQGRNTIHRNLVEDTDQLVLHILEKDREVLRELLTTNQSFVQYSDIKAILQAAAKNPKTLREAEGNLVAYYNLTLDQWSVEQPLTLPAAQRAGVLTQPSWLIAHSNNMDNQPIHRGRWIHEHLLGGTIPNTPITVDAKLPDEPHNSLRERMRFTRDAYCWTCHQRMNPIGVTFEMFNQHGQFRTEEMVTVKKAGKNTVVGLPVDSSGAVLESGVPSLDGPAENAIALVHRLAKSEHVHQVFVRHAFRYWMGRNETLDDAPTLQAAYRAYQESNGSMKALIAALLTSDSFLYRRPLARH